MIATGSTRSAGSPGSSSAVSAACSATADSFAAAGIRLLLITGDHPATATAIADRLGIWHDGDRVVHGGTPELAQASDAQVFARVQPGQKLDIVAALQDRRHVVAMTGDGVNDAPPCGRPTSGSPWAAAPRWPGRPPT